MSVIRKDLGMVTAYAYAVSKGYTGTEEQFATLMASYADVGQTAVDAALAAKASEDAAKASETASAASQAAAATSAGTATTAAQNASQSATAASGSATSAAGSATAAAGSATTAGNKATEAAGSATAAAGSATTAGASATAAQAAQTAAETAQTAAETAQGAAEDAAESVSASVAQIDQNTADISLVKSHLEAFPDDGTAANAKQLLTDKGITESVPYLFRRSGGDGADREFDTLVGGTIVWNQLALNTRSGNTDSGITFTPNGNGQYTLNGTADGSPVWRIINPNYTPEANHVYIHWLKSTGDKVFLFRNGYTSTKANNSYVITKYNISVVFSLMVVDGSVVDNEIVVPQIFDLTQMFGSTIADYIYSLEQATAGAGVAFFRSLFPEDYYPYDAGTLKSVEGVSAHVTAEFNLFDKSTSVSGAITADGSIGANPNRTVSDWIKALPNTDYYVVGIVPASDGHGIALYDSGKGYIKTVSPAGASTLTSGTFMTTADTAYIRIGMLNANVNDACLNFSDPAKNGTYEPYNGHTYALDDSLTLRGIPKLDANNSLYYDGDTYAADGTVTRKYNYLLFDGDESWALQSVNEYGIANFYLTVDKYVRNQNSRCNRFALQTSSIASTTDEGYFFAANEFLYVRISSSKASTVAEFKTWLAANLTEIIYELATSTTEEAEPFQSPQICSPYGTEEYITTGIVPVGHSTFYPENLRAKIEELPSNFSTLIAPTESAYVATQNYTSGSLFIVNNVLYKATANIANGGTITPGTNCTATTLAEIISALS